MSTTPKFNVDTKIDINFTEEQIKSLLANTVTDEMPGVTVNDITFVIKRNPTNISASVDASMNGLKATVECKEEEIEVPAKEPESVSDFLDLDS